MIFTREQWQRVYAQHRADRAVKDIIRPNELILGILTLDALEHGIHQSWVDFWLDPNTLEANARWANLLYVMINPQCNATLQTVWSKPR